MTGLLALTKKELKEQVKTYKLLAVGAVLLFFGLSTPLLIKFLPELVKMSGEDVGIQMPQPTAAMALAEYSDSMVQVGVLMVLLTGMGAIARERERGTAALVLTKPVSRGAFVLAKFLALLSTLIVGIVLAGSAALFYTRVLFGGVEAGPFMFMNLLILVFLAFCSGVTVLCSSIFRNQLIAGAVALAVVVAQALLGTLPTIGRYMPSGIVGWGTGIVVGAGGSRWESLAATLGLMAVCTVLAVWVLQRKEL